MSITTKSLPSIVPGFCSLIIEDSEPLENATDHNSTHVLHFECQLTLISSNPNRYSVSTNGTSHYSNTVSISYNSSENTLYFELNDVGAGNGGTFSGSAEYEQAGTVPFVYAKVKKGTSSAGGPNKHKIATGTERD